MRIFPHLVLTVPWIWLMTWLIVAWRLGEIGTVGIASAGFLFTALEAGVQLVIWDESR